jgi:hypothetical protein
VSQWLGGTFLYFIYDGSDGRSVSPKRLQLPTGPNVINYETTAEIISFRANTVGFV